jgi:hypothetical protein
MTSRRMVFVSRRNSILRRDGQETPAGGPGVSNFAGFHDPAIRYTRRGPTGYHDRMDEYLCITVVSQSDESQSDFAARLSRFWTHMLRNHKDDFEKVYAETTAFGAEGARITRQYLVRQTVADLLEREFAANGLGHEPIDRDDVFSKYEAAPPDWMWIEH